MQPAQAILEKGAKLNRHVLFEAIDCPELNTLGCDHDLAGYPLIENAVQYEFRRPCTIAKGSDCCHFHFYRKGTAPDTIHLNQ